MMTIAHRAASMLSVPLALVAAIGSFAIGAEDTATVVTVPDSTRTNVNYHGNREPLLASPLIKLPLGAIKPKGWLRKQLELEANGFTGWLFDISEFCRHEDNAWLSPIGEGKNGWEEVPYWLRGFAALGYVLDDKRIMDESRLWIENAIVGQMADGYFGPRANLKEPLAIVGKELFKTNDGSPGLDAEYFDGSDSGQPKLKRVDAQIDFKWDGKAPAEGVNAGRFSARWTGKLAIPTTGDYIFVVESDDGARLTLDGKVAIDNLATGRNKVSGTTRPIHCEAGKPLDLALEYAQRGGGSELRLLMGNAYYSGRSTPDLMPNMSMMFALRAYYEYTGDKRVIDMLTRYFKWELQVPDKHFFSGGWQVPRTACNMESVFWLYNITGDKFLLELTDKLRRCGSSWMTVSNGGHNVDHSQGFKKPAQFYQQNKDPAYLLQTEKNYDAIQAIYGQVPGGMFGGDEFARPGYTDPRQAIETCGCVEMMMSCEILLRLTGDLAWAERCENPALNTLPATTTADLKALRYLTSPNQSNSDMRSKEPGLADGGPMQLMNPYQHRCCQHNFGMGWPFFAESLWNATPGNGLAAIFYSASEVHAKVGAGTDIAITENTRYPFDEKIEFVFAPRAPVAFPFYLRVPGWCSKPEVAVNGRKLDVQGKPLSYILIEREWKTGDKVEFTVPMDLAVKVWEKNKNSVSINRGPLSYSLKIGEQYRRPDSKDKNIGGTDKWPAWEILATTPWNYGLVLDSADPLAGISVAKKPYPANDMPFTHEGAPIEITAKAKKIVNWREDFLGLIDELEPSPVRSDQPLESITLIPMGAARIRLCSFPTIGDGPTATNWKLPPDQMTSFGNGRRPDGSYPLWCINDGLTPSSSSDDKSAFFTWHNPWQLGMVHWLRQNLPEEMMVSSSDIYLNTSKDPLPERWRLLYLSGTEWKEVPNPSGYPLEADHFLQVRFDPVKTSALRFEAKCRERSSVGTYEWHIWTAPVQGVKKHWVQQNFRERSVQSCEVTWLLTSGTPSYQPPRSWRLLYRDGDAWKEVAAKSPYGIDGTKPDTVSFAPVTTTALRLEVSCAEAASASTKDWKIK